MEHQIHADHDHQHTRCGHKAIKHNGHSDYLHDGHLHHEHDGHYDECTIEVSEANPADCTNGHSCEGHEAGQCTDLVAGMRLQPHGDLIDYLVDGHLPSPHAW